MRISFDDIFKNLKNDMYCIYVLYTQAKTDDTWSLPDFIDRGKAFEKLVNLGLAENKSGSKHLHNDIYIVTTDGKHFIEQLESQIDCNIFGEAPLDNKDKFDKLLNDSLTNVDKKFQTEKLDENLELMIKTPLNKEVKRNEVELIFLGFKRISERENEFEYLFKFDVKCDRCHNHFVFSQKVLFNADKYNFNPSHFKKKCPQCQNIFKMDSYIADWWFEEE
ncbi:MAG: hypothetical protein GF353_22995 [Candidatus Lokiarchaeota archaeon]|nr:hypothetical protein [Candidatus Lokiarchaeota archaeon]